MFVAGIDDGRIRQFVAGQGELGEHHDTCLRGTDENRVARRIARHATGYAAGLGDRDTQRRAR